MEGWAGTALAATAAGLTAADLPRGSAPRPVAFPHFPDRLHALVWRNWQLVPAPRLAEVVGASVGDIVRLGRSMGLSGPPRITVEQQRRAALSVIKRNWHLLPYEQLLQLLGWTAEEMAFTLREDDFLFVKLGNLKPQCERLQFRPPDARARERARAIAGILRAEFPAGVGQPEQPLFEFVKELSRPPKSGGGRVAGASAFSPRFCYSYFALYGDSLLDPTLDPYPDVAHERHTDVRHGLLSRESNDITVYPKHNCNQRTPRNKKPDGCVDNVKPSCTEKVFRLLLATKFERRRIGHVHRLRGSSLFDT